jgi:hypothetical protein
MSTEPNLGGADQRRPPTGPPARAIKAAAKSSKIRRALKRLAATDRSVLEAAYEQRHALMPRGDDDDDGRSEAARQGLAAGVVRRVKAAYRQAIADANAIGDSSRVGQLRARRHNAEAEAVGQLHDAHKAYRAAWSAVGDEDRDAHKARQRRSEAKRKQLLVKIETAQRRSSLRTLGLGWADPRKLRDRVYEYLRSVGIECG